MQPVAERRDHPEVAPAPAEAPEQVGVLVGGCTHQLALGRDELGRDEVVGGETVLSLEPADAAAEREAGDPRARDDPERRREPERLRLAVERRAERPALGSGDPGLRIDVHRLHRREIDDDAAVARPEPADVVAAAAHGDRELGRPGEPHGFNDVGHPSAPRHERRVPVDRRVPDHARRVVAGVAGRDHLTSQPSGQPFDRFASEFPLRRGHRSPFVLEFVEPSVPPRGRRVQSTIWTQPVLDVNLTASPSVPTVDACAATASSVRWPRRARCWPSGGRRSSSASCCAAAIASTTCSAACR